MRRMVREVRLAPSDLVYPIFVTRDQAGPIEGMPGVSRLTVEGAVEAANEAAAAGLSGILLFGIPQTKDETGTRALSPTGIIPEAVRAIKRCRLDLVIITDICLCSYTTHGHCGLIRNKVLSNDATLPVLAQMARIHADSGADIVAPSAMMDHQVGAIRTELDAAGHQEVGILSYSAKYASAFYGPFRDAAGGAPQFGDRRMHQMDPGNAYEALREIEMDLEEGADLVMVKPALAYLDVIRRIRDQWPQVPLFAYNVSGEYAMLKAAVQQGYAEERPAVLEVLSSIRRAGAQGIITYHALDAARWLNTQPAT
ncbi:MAG: porphobilinogen synthase [Rhodothermaceae bacterium]|nr:porphobilinogen synthase [Rhodothermaceae bacterium]MYF63184.1 porphobilinogen synthase [Rhodothermaceae bacterium]MYI84402.1 porphobilinogen synthase [Rhodothermaceae bacterium]